MAVWTTARVTIYDSSLVSQGTISNVTFMKGSYALNRIGDGEFVFHAYDTPAVDITKYNRIAVGEVYNTLTAAYQNVFCIYITSIRPVDQGNGVFMHVSGPNILHELTNDTLDFNLVSDGSGGKSTTWVDDILGYAANAWTSTDMGTGSTGGYLPAAEESVFDALVEVHKQNGHSVSYHPSGAPARDVVSVLQNIDGGGANPFDDLDLSQPLDPTTIQSDTTAAYIRQIEMIEDAADIVTRVYPYGAGMGRERITLAEAEGDVTVPGGFTVDWTNNHITNTTLEAETDQQRVTVRKHFAHIKPETFDSADANFTAANDTAAEQLFDAAIAFLQERNSDRRKSYRVIAMCHGDYSPGQQVNLNYTVTSPIDANGAENPTAVVSVNEDIILHEIEHTWDARTGERVSTLTLSQQVFDKRTDQGEDQVIKAIKGFEEIIRHTTAWPTPIDTTDWSDIIFGDLPIGDGLDGTGPNIDLGTPGTITSTSTNTVTASSHTHAVDGTIATHDPVTLSTDLGNNLLGLSTQQLTLDSQSANTVFAAPDGSAGAPSFRALVAADIPGGSGAPDDATYVVISNTADLSAERALTAGDGLDLTDGGINSTVTLAVDVTDILGNGLTESSNNIVLGTPGTLTSSTTNSVTASSHTHALDSTAIGAPSDSTYVVISNTTDLSAERALTAGDGLDLTDGGANSTVTLTVDVTEILGDGLTETSNNVELGTPSTITSSTTNNVTATSHTHAVDSTVIGAPVDSTYVVISNTADLSAERALTAGDGLDLSDGGANSSVTLSVDVTDIIGNGITESSNNIVLGTPGSVTSTSTNSVTASSHTHAVDSTIATSSDLHDAVTLSADVTEVIGLSGQDIYLQNKSGNTVLASPSGGGSGNPTYRSLVAADLPTGSTLSVSSSNSGTSHAITTSSNPGTNSRILATDSSGHLTLDTLFINDTSNAKMNQGITINQGTFTNEILALKSSDIAHGMTSIAETDTYCHFTKIGDGPGGVIIHGFGETDSSMILSGHVVSEQTGKASNAAATNNTDSWKKSGTGRTALSTSANIFCVRNGSVSKAIFGADGDLYLDTVINQNHWDDYDDIQLLHGMRALFMPDGHDLQTRFGQFMEDAREILERTGVVHFNDDGHHFIATKKLQMLTVDALRQAYERLDKRIAALEEKA